MMLPPPPWNELGEGLWGIVFDLGDGSVLKLVRKRGGLGSPAALIHREVAAIKALGGGRCGGFDMPELLGHGDIDLPANPFVAPLEGWLRLSKLNGRRLGDAIPPTPDGRQRLGETLAPRWPTFTMTPKLSVMLRTCHNKTRSCALLESCERRFPNQKTKRCATILKSAGRL